MASVILIFKTLFFVTLFFVPLVLGLFLVRGGFNEKIGKVLGIIMFILSALYYISAILILFSFLPSLLSGLLFKEIIVYGSKFLIYVTLFFVPLVLGFLLRGEVFSRRMRKALSIVMFILSFIYFIFALIMIYLTIRYGL